ncbi:DUF7522 family protein [Halorarius halobius]|uniref:DUF7522 family protein n=1 Tax=Halorarius halobius TaxID=2962671 RepID=UPI0020CC1342|nr:hypothetical protein [Halorarius halobius]
MSSNVSEDLAESLREAARTAIGDELRSLTYFTEDAVEQVYLRDDLEADADLVGFADVERLGFHSQAGYRDTELGDYEFTIRVFENGYLVRVIAGDSGVFATTDTMARDRFEDVAGALEAILADA